MKNLKIENNIPHKYLLLEPKIPKLFKHTYFL